MKAWKVGADFIDGVFLVHAETAGKAKYRALRHTELYDFDPEYQDLRVTRCPSLDDIPFTLENAETELYFPDAVDEDGNIYTGEYCTREDYRNECPCEICRAAKALAE